MRTFKINKPKNTAKVGFKGSVFFFVVSIFVFSIVGLASFFKVTTFLYSQDVAYANKFNTAETLSTLPMTGTPDDQFFLMVMTVILAVAVTFAIMLKLSRMKIKESDENKKPKKFSIKNNPALFILFSALILTLIFGLALFVKQGMEVSTTQTTNQNEELSLVDLENTTRTPGSVESFYLTANPKTYTDTVAMVRLQFSNVKILNVDPNYALTIGTCNNGLIFTDNSICADVSNTEKFKFGDKLFKVTVQWGDTAEYEITSMAENGYFNGTEATKDDVVLAFSPLSFLPFTGEEEPESKITSQESITTFVLVGGGFILILILLIILIRTHPVFKKVAVFYSITLIVILGGSAVYISNELQKEQEIVEAEAADWYNCDDKYDEICTDYSLFRFWRTSGDPISLSNPGKYKSCVNAGTLVCDELETICTTSNDRDDLKFDTDLGFYCFFGQAKCQNCPNCEEKNAYGPLRYLQCGSATATPTAPATATPTLTLCEDKDCSDTQLCDTVTNSCVNPCQTKRIRDMVPDNLSYYIQDNVVINGKYCITKKTSNNSIHKYIVNCPAGGTMDICTADCTSQGQAADVCGPVPTATVTVTGPDPTTTYPPNPTGTNPPNPTATSTNTPPGSMQCGQIGCTDDDQCEVGPPQYECDQKANPSQNVCIRLCPPGETRVDNCTCTGGTGVACGPLDVDGDSKLTYVDLGAFAQMYNKTCTDSFTAGTCGGKDSNNDGVINYIDLGYFVSKYFPKALTCTK